MHEEVCQRSHIESLQGFPRSRQQGPIVEDYLGSPQQKVFQFLFFQRLGDTSEGPNPTYNVLLNSGATSETSNVILCAARGGGVDNNRRGTCFCVEINLPYSRYGGAMKRDGGK